MNKISGKFNNNITGGEFGLLLRNKKLTAKKVSTLSTSVWIRPD